jgi:hypothetical protein
MPESMSCDIAASGASEWNSTVVSFVALTHGKGH